MQQQYFALSPMAGQESFSAIDVRPVHHIMAHTPTTSSMLAALQHDAFPSGSLDPTSSGFNSDAYGPLSYMDTSPTQDDPISAVHQPGLSFTDFAGASNSFDVSAFASQDLNMNSSATPAASEVDDSEPVKSEVQ
jgi:regulatory factor X